MTIIKKKKANRIIDNPNSISLFHFGAEIPLLPIFRCAIISIGDSSTFPGLRGKQPFYTPIFFGHN